jgi:5-methylcytosine-specific restriction endonuclease McrA
MNFDAICSFLENTSARLETSWQMPSLNSIAGLRVPDFITGRQDTVLRADINTLWTQWFLESICDPERFVESYPGYAHIVHAVKIEVPSLFTNIEVSKHGELIKQISRLVDKEIQRRQTRNRIAFDTSIKDALWDVYGPEPRCWICGYRFSQWAIDKFLGRVTAEEIPQPQFIDYLKPRSLNKRDFQIEIDHVFPFAGGGDDDPSNLRLACGWCNSYKSDRLSIYDVAAKPPVIQHPNLGRVSVPHPFWSVRLLSLHRRCEHEGGCDKTIENSELTVTSRHQEGSMNPVNLRVTCLDHDHIGSNRFISKALAERLFKR